MDPALKHRLIGAAVLSAIAIIFLPMLMVGHDVNDTASSVPLKVPAAPAGDFQTRELPLVAPSPNVPSGGVVGMDTSHPAPPASGASPASTTGDASGAASAPASPAATASGPASSAASPASPASPGPATVVASPRTALAASPATVPPPASVASPKAPAASPQAAVAPPPAASAAAATPIPPPAASPASPVPAANAGGHYVVSLGIYSNTANAQSLVASLQAKQLPAYSESVTAGGKTATRVRIGPFQQRGDAEAARLRAQQVRKDLPPTNVTALDAAVAAPAVAPAPAPSPSGMAGSVTLPSNKQGASVASPKAPAASGAPDTTARKVPLPAVAATGESEPAAPSVGRGYVVQVTAFRSEDEALKLRGKLRTAGFTAFSEKVQTDSGTLFRVRIGPAANRDDADHLRTELSAKLGLSSMVVAYP